MPSSLFSSKQRPNKSGYSYNLAFWDTLRNDTKVEIYSKVIKKIFIQSGQVQQIQFNIEPR